jgi:hypothetical protein
MQNACAHHDSSLLALVASGAVPPALSITSELAIVDTIVSFSPSTLSRAARPDLPPPRS